MAPTHGSGAHRDEPIYAVTAKGEDGSFPEEEI